MVTVQFWRIISHSKTMVRDDFSTKLVSDNVFWRLLIQFLSYCVSCRLTCLNTGSFYALNDTRRLDEKQNINNFNLMKSISLYLTISLGTHVSMGYVTQLQSST